MLKSGLIGLLLSSPNVSRVPFCMHVKALGRSGRTGAHTLRMCVWVTVDLTWVAPGWV